jgi:Zn-dependent alcohol dehydrogenase
MKVTAALENDSGMFIMEELDLENPRNDEVLVKIIFIKRTDDKG